MATTKKNEVVKGDGAMRLIREILGKDTSKDTLKEITDQYDVEISYPEELNKNGASGYRMCLKSKDGSSTFTKEAVKFGNSDFTGIPEYDIPSTTLRRKYNSFLDLAKIKKEFMEGKKDMAQEKKNNHQGQYTFEDAFAGCLGILGEVFGAFSEYCDAASAKSENLKQKAQQKQQEVKEQQKYKDKPCENCKNDEHQKTRAEQMKETILKQQAEKKAKEAQEALKEAKDRKSINILKDILGNLLSNGTYLTEYNENGGISDVKVCFKVKMEKPLVSRAAKEVADEWGYAKAEYMLDNDGTYHVKFFFK